MGAIAAALKAAVVVSMQRRVSSVMKPSLGWLLRSRPCGGIIAADKPSSTPSAALSTPRQRFYFTGAKACRAKALGEPFEDAEAEIAENQQHPRPDECRGDI